MSLDDNTINKEQHCKRQKIMTDSTYERQKLWSDYRKSKIDRSTTERDEKRNEELTFKPKINKKFNVQKKVQSRLLQSTNATRNSSVYGATKQQQQQHQQSSKSSKSSKRQRGGGGSDRSTKSNQSRAAHKVRQTTNSKKQQQQKGGDGDGDGVEAASGGEVFDLSDGENDLSSSSVSSVSSNDEGSDPLASDVYGINPPQNFHRQTTTGISLHVARQRQARLRKEEISSGAAYRTKRAALSARPFNLSVTNVPSSSSGVGGGTNSSGLGGLGGRGGGGGGGGHHGGSADEQLYGSVSSASVMKSNAGGVTDADIRNMLREHRSELQDLRQEHAVKMASRTVEGREAQEDALIRQEVKFFEIFFFVLFLFF